MPSYSQRHPSRDRGPNDYLLHPKGIEVKGSGHYEDVGDLDRAASFWRSERPVEASESDHHAQHAVVQPEQPHLFAADKRERAQATKRSRPQSHTGSYEGESVHNQQISRSTIPTSHLQSRRYPKSGRDVAQ